VYSNASIADHHFSESTNIMTVADELSLNQSKSAARNYDRLIILSYAAFSVIFMGLVYADSKSPGTDQGKLASISAFP
jgi:hypothetical protein